MVGGVGNGQTQDELKLTPWEVQEGQSLYRYQVLSAPDRGGARTVLYQGSSLATANCIGAAPDTLKALQGFPFKIAQAESWEEYAQRVCEWWEKIGHPAQVKGEGRS